MQEALEPMCPGLRAQGSVRCFALLPWTTVWCCALSCQYANMGLIFLRSDFQSQLSRSEPVTAWHPFKALRASGNLLRPPGNAHCFRRAHRRLDPIHPSPIIDSSTFHAHLTGPCADRAAMRGGCARLLQQVPLVSRLAVSPPSWGRLEHLQGIRLYLSYSHMPGG